MRIANRRFEKLAKRMGFKVLHGKRDKDIDEVIYKGLKIFSIPSRMNAYKNDLHRWHNMVLPNLHDLEIKTRVMWFRNNNSFWFRDMIKEVANQKFNPQEYV